MYDFLRLDVYLYPTTRHAVLQQLPYIVRMLDTFCAGPTVHPLLDAKTAAALHDTDCDNLKNLKLNGWKQTSIVRVKHLAKQIRQHQDRLSAIFLCRGWCPETSHCVKQSIDLTSKVRSCIKASSKRYKNEHDIC